MAELSQDEKKSKKDNRVGTITNWFVRIAFVSAVLIGSRCFLPFSINRSGLLEVLTSFSMMLLSILIVERFLGGILRKLVLFFTGALFIFFHLVNGAYYRFFNRLMPPGVFRQFSDLFVVGNDGAALVSVGEYVMILFLPAALLLALLFKPARAKCKVFVILLVIIGIGWGYRLVRFSEIRYEVRPIDKIAALPSFIYRTGYVNLKFGFGEQRYRDIVHNISTVVPRSLNGYRIVPNRGITVEPLNSNSNSDSQKYNVILILMESVRAYECGFLGSTPSFTPRLDELTKKARVYDNFYANGTLTVRGEFAILCSVYPNPFGVPTYLTNPSINLISLPQILSEAGYDTLWFSGYTADFHNKRAFLSRHGIKKIIDRDVLPQPREPIIGWGMSDKEMFKYVWETIKDNNEPFFAEIMTLSNHHVKGRQYPTSKQTPATNASSEYQAYLNGTYYTDYAVSDFIANVLESELAKNTIIIITGDHGLWIFPDNVTDPLQKKEIYFRSPLCIWGPRDVVSPALDHTLGSQVDIAPTLLDMLNIYHTNTFLGQSLVDNSISQEQRYVVSYLGNKPSFRIGNIFMMADGEFQNRELDSKRRIYAKLERMDDYKGYTFRFALVDGDPLRGNYALKSLLGSAQAGRLSKQLDDLTFLVGYGTYFNKFMGVEQPR